MRPITIAVLSGVLLLLSALLEATTARASDHLDAPTVIADPSADIGDLYAWTSPDGRRLNLVMTIVGKRFSDQLAYVFHVDSGARFPETKATTSIVCRFDAGNVAECWAGDDDYARGDADRSDGLEGRNRRFRVFAGLRDDPFFNNVKGTRSAYNAAAEALAKGAPMDAEQCATFDEATTQEILGRWRRTDDGPAVDFLAGWESASLVVSVDLGTVTRGGDLLAVWAATYTLGASASSDNPHARPEIGPAVDRIGRPLTGNALLGPLDPVEVSSARKEAYNRAGPAEWQRHAKDIQRNLGLYDSFDGVCGNQWLADRNARPSMRYRALAEMLADDRLWVNTASRECKRFMAVELAAAGAGKDDCGGRTPAQDAVDVYRSLLVNGTTDGVDDGVDSDDRVHSSSEFPFLAAP